MSERANSTLLEIAKDIAANHGFSQLGITRFPLPEREAQRLREMGDASETGSMSWLSETAQLRAHPETRWPQCKSVLCLATSYRPTIDPLQAIKRSDTAVFASYAHNKDYHIIISKRLKKLTRALQSTIGGEYRAFVDTAPLAEKPLSAMAGIGWQGKHTNLVSRHFGSWLLLSVVLSDQVFPISQPADNLCGSCTKCQKVCPTNALDTAYKLNITSCLAYLSIEHDGPIPVKWRKAMGNRIFGCDDCLAVCPWNKFARTASDLAAYARQDLQDVLIGTLLTLTPEQFAIMFKQNPVKRLKWHRLIRNALVVAGNSKDCNLLPIVDSYRTHDDDVIQESASWAYRSLAENCMTRL